MDQVKQMIKACIVSRKGGVPVTEIDNDYRQLVGTKIPYTKYGYVSLEDFIQSIAEVMMIHNPDGSIILKSRDTKMSHIASLVEGQKTAVNARKKVTNCYRMSSAGQNYTRGASSNWHYEKNRGNNRKMESIAPGHVTQGDNNIARDRKQEMGQLRTSNAESIFKDPMEKEITRGIETYAEKYSSQSAYKENEVHHCQTKHPFEMSSHCFQQRNSTVNIHHLDDPRGEFNKSQVKVKNHRRISVDDTILVTIVNNYYRSSANGHSRQRKSFLSEWKTEDDGGEIRQDHLCRCSKHLGCPKGISTVRQKCRLKSSRLGETLDCYEELYVQKKWIGDSVNDYARNVSEDHIREDSGYTHYKRDVSRKMSGLLIKVKNEYAIDRRI